MGWEQFVGIVGGAFVVLGAASKWLIADWYKKAQEIERLKAQNTKRALDSLAKDVEKVQSSNMSMKTSLVEHGRKLEVTDKQITFLSQKIDESVKTMQTMQTNLNAVIKREIKSEIIELGKRATLIRTKKDGN